VRLFELRRRKVRTVLLVNQLYHGKNQFAALKMIQNYRSHHFRYWDPAGGFKFPAVAR